MSETDANSSSSSEPRSAARAQLGPCSACGRMVSVAAPTCPSCGQPSPVTQDAAQRHLEILEAKQAKRSSVTRERKKVLVAFLGLLLAGAAGTFIVCSLNPSPPDFYGLQPALGDRFDSLPPVAPTSAYAVQLGGWRVWKSLGPWDPRSGEPIQTVSRVEEDGKFFFAIGEQIKTARMTVVLQKGEIQKVEYLTPCGERCVGAFENVKRDLRKWGPFFSDASRDCPMMKGIVRERKWTLLGWTGTAAFYACGEASEYEVVVVVE